MKRVYPVLIVLALTLALAGSAQSKKKPPSGPPPGYPGKAATHSLILQKVQLSDFDFSRDTAGQPMPITIEITEDGALMAPTSGDTTMAGTRGEHMLQAPTQWMINFDPHKNYQVIITEVVPLGGSGKRITVPATPKQGFWPFGEFAGKVFFGKESYLLFVDKTQ